MCSSDLTTRDVDAAYVQRLFRDYRGDKPLTVVWDCGNGAGGPATEALVKKLPRADAWMHEFKVIGGLVEVGAAAKFLAICDAAWGWGVFRRGSVVALWAAIAVLIASYILGWIRLDMDKRLEHVGPGRLITAMVAITLALWLLHGLAGGHLGVVESFFPADEAPRM